MTVGSGQFDCQWNAVPIANQMALAATFSPICRIWASLQPPKIARTEQLSTTARDQSIWPSRESQFSNAKWIKSQIPCSCQSRKRRQQVMPEPTTQFFRQHPPGDTTSEHENDAREASPVCQAGSATLRLGQRNWEKRFDQTPERIRNEHGSHVKVPQHNRMLETLPRHKGGFVTGS